MRGRSGERLRTKVLLVYRSPGFVLRQRKNVEGAAFGRVLRQVLHGVGKAQRNERVCLGQDSQGGRSCPSSNSREYRDVLPAIGAEVGDRLTDDSGAYLELPEQLTGTGVHRLEPSIHGTVEGDVTGRNYGTTPYREAFPDLPYFPASYWIPGGKDPAMSAGPCEHADLRAHIRCAGDVVRFHTFVVHTQVVMWEIEQPGAR